LSVGREGHPRDGKFGFESTRLHGRLWRGALRDELEHVAITRLVEAPGTSSPLSSTASCWGGASPGSPQLAVWLRLSPRRKVDEVGARDGARGSGGEDSAVGLCASRARSGLMTTGTA